MEININDIDFDNLRCDLIDYFGIASGVEPFAMSDVINVECATNIQLLDIINYTDLDLANYIQTDKSNRL